MKHVIEIISAPSAHQECFARAIVDDTNPDVIRSKATQLMEIWSKHGAARARVVDENGQTTMEIDGQAGG